MRGICHDLACHAGEGRTLRVSPGASLGFLVLPWATLRSKNSWPGECGKRIWVIAAMWRAWSSCPLPRRESRWVTRPARGHLDGGGAGVGREVITIPEAGDVARVADDHRRDDRSHPEELGERSAR